MRIVSLIDNISRCECEAEHGLSLYVELACGAKILFDTGQTDMFARNADRLGIDLSQVDLAVISHGHYDHGGGLNEFLRLNSKAKVYLRESALENHISVRPEGKVNIGLNISDKSRLIFCKDIEQLPYGITLFSNPPAVFPEPVGNRLLLGPDARPDTFPHEQSMIIREDTDITLPPSSQSSDQPSNPATRRATDHSTDPSPNNSSGIVALFGGCAHRGIVNILAKAQSLTSGSVTHVISGFHLSKSTPGTPTGHILDQGFGLFPCPEYSTTHPDEPSRTMFQGNNYLNNLAEALMAYPGIQYYTMHCTGEAAFAQLAALMPSRLTYLPSGSSLTL